MMKAKNVQSIICLVFFFLFANQAWAADWIYYDTAAVGDMLYYDKSSIKKENESIVSVWTKNILSEETKTKYVSILKGIHKAPDNPSRLSYYKKLTEIDCVNKKMKGVSVIFYDKKGKVVYSSPKGDSGEWNAILPNTVGEKLINIVSCEPVTPKEAVVAPKVEEPATPKEAVIAPKVEEPATPKEAVVAPKVEEPVTPKEAVVAPKVEEPATPKEAIVAPKVEEPATPKEAVIAPKVEEPATPVDDAKVKEPVASNEAVTAVAAPAVTDKNPVQVNNTQIETKSASEEAVRNLLTKWLNSWKSGHMKTYRSCYASNFQSEVTYINALVSYKTDAHQKSKKINISIDKLQISADANIATAVFTQHYSSAILKYSGKKKLELRKINDEWKIYREIM
jgi:outer membrane biosynthesis protein TonB